MFEISRFTNVIKIFQSTKITNVNGKISEI